MELFGIGALELIYILLIALIVLGPKDMVKAGRTIGKFLRKVVMSPSWRTVQNASQEFRHLPNKLIREAGLEEFEHEVKEINKISKSYLDDVKRTEKEITSLPDDISSWITPPTGKPSSGTLESSDSNPDEPQVSDPPSDLAETPENGQEETRRKINNGRD